MRSWGRGEQLGRSAPSFMKSSVPHEHKASLRKPIHESPHGNRTPRGCLRLSPGQAIGGALGDDIEWGGPTDSTEQMRLENRPLGS